MAKQRQRSLKLAVVAMGALLLSGCTPLQGPSPSSGGSILPVAPSPVPTVPTDGVPKFRLFAEGK